MIIKKGPPTLLEKIEQNMVPVGMFIIFLILVLIVFLVFGPVQIHRIIQNMY
jgi:hypothetical protein